MIEFKSNEKLICIEGCFEYYLKGNVYTLESCGKILSSSSNQNFEGCVTYTIIGENGMSISISDEEGSMKGAGVNIHYYFESYAFFISNQRNKSIGDICDD